MRCCCGRDVIRTHIEQDCTNKSSQANSGQNSPDTLHGRECLLDQRQLWFGDALTAVSVPPSPSDDNTLV
jgi:hypothetical protein